MINPYTLAIKRITIPEKIMASLYTQFNIVLLCACSYAAMDTITSAVYAILDSDAAESGERYALLFGLSIATSLVFMCGWFLSAKRQVRFHGFAVLTALIAGWLKIEQLFHTAKNFSNAADP